MDKRYQVFLSSTFDDLKEERLEAMKAIVELDCFPCGMEYFPASDLDQWSYIKSLIRQCDYYIVIIAGRYGSTDDNGISYTQKEYEYAVSQNIPVIAFIHGDPNNIPFGNIEQDQDARRKLEAFKELTKKRLCKFWTSKFELSSVLSRSLSQLIKSTERPGWVKAENLSDKIISEEIGKLNEIIKSKDETITNLNFGLSECLKKKAPRKSEEIPSYIYDVFIAYSSNDENEASRLHRVLETAGLTCFMSSKSLMAGDVWSDTIRDSLLKSREILLLCSPSSMHSDWVQTELGAAWVLNKRVIPVLFRIDIESLPYQLKHFQSYDYCEIGADSRFVKEMTYRSGKPNK